MAVCWEGAVPLAFHLCCFNFSAVLVVRVPFPFGVWAGCGIRLYRFLIIAFFLLFNRRGKVEATRFLLVYNIRLGTATLFYQNEL